MNFVICINEFEEATDSVNLFEMYHFGVLIVLLYHSLDGKSMT